MIYFALLALAGTVLAASCTQPEESAPDVQEAQEPALADELSGNDLDTLSSDESLPESCAKACYAGPAELAEFCRALQYYPDRSMSERCKAYINGSKVKCVAWCLYAFGV